MTASWDDLFDRAEGYDVDDELLWRTDDDLETQRASDDATAAGEDSTATDDDSPAVRTDAPEEGDDG
ncbi:hypothetical protein AB7C87_19040 [Natrarchaeobius sp. A-rgal3]|uniref:hypothetical protein n=1 Tax=Natrarchaeobius versutus TaxID=1679078 RepID=UPI0035100977